MDKDKIAQELEAYADFLRLDGQEGRAYAYEKAANAINRSRYIPPVPSRLDGIGESTQEDVVNLENGFGIKELEELRERYQWFKDFRRVKHIGPSRAEEIYETLGIDSLELLNLAAKEGDLQLIQGIGPATEKEIRKSIESLK